jgi:hypothetical protein
VDSNETYTQLAQSYTTGARQVLGLSDELGGERQEETAETLLAQAEQLLPVSQQLNQAAAARYVQSGEAAREEAALQLLAKSLIDLQLALQLSQVSGPAQNAPVSSADELRERTIPAPEATPAFRLANAELEEALGLLQEKPGHVEVEPSSDETERSEGDHRQESSDAAGATDPRQQLIKATGKAVEDITAETAKTAQTALGGLLGQGASTLLQAVGIVSTDIANVLGQGENLSRAHAVIQGFFANAVAALQKLVGKKILDKTSSWLVGWIGDLDKGETVGKLLGKLYQSEELNKELGRQIRNSTTDPANFSATAQKVQTLRTSYQRQLKVLRGISTSLKFANLLPFYALPQVKLGVAGLYVLLGSYVMVAGADYLDVETVKFINLVPGLRQVIREGLPPAPEGAQQPG